MTKLSISTILMSMSPFFEVSILIPISIILFGSTILEEFGSIEFYLISYCIPIIILSLIPFMLELAHADDYEDIEDTEDKSQLKTSKTSKSKPTAR
ncbi:MAG: hypothetical protein QXL51_04985 [Candidatus Aenigmatarchaeota archaeon]